MIIAVDFDGTLQWEMSGTYGSMVVANAELIKMLINRRVRGDELILWTCREGEWLDEAVKWCKSMGLEFDSVNENAPSQSANLCGKHKVIADIYIDDKATNPIEFINGRELKWKK